MIVIIGGRGRCDGDLGGRHPRGEQAARPAHRLDGFVIGRRCADGADLRPMPRRARDGDSRAVEPRRNAPGASGPLYGDVVRQGLEQRPPARRKLGKAGDLHGAKDRRGVIDAGGRGRDDINRTHHARRKPLDDRRFQARDGGKARMVGRVHGQIDTRAPGFVQCVGGCVDHAGERLDALQFAHRRHRQGRLDGRAQALVVDGTGEAAGQPDGGLLEGHDLKAVTTVTACHQPAFPHGEATVNNQSASTRDGHNRSPPGRYFLFRRCVDVGSAIGFARSCRERATSWRRPARS